MPSRVKKSRDASSDSADQYPANGMAGNFGSPPSGADGAAALGLTVASAPPGELDAGQAPPVDHPLLKQAPGRMLRNWRVRSRLVLLIAIPTATAVALGGVSIVGSWRSAVANQRTETLASLSTKVTRLAFQIEAERDAIVWYIAAGVNGRAFTFLKPPGKTASKDAVATYAAEQTASAGQLQIVDQQFTFTKPWTTGGERECLADHLRLSGGGAGGRGRGQVANWARWMTCVTSRSPRWSRPPP